MPHGDTPDDASRGLSPAVIGGIVAGVLSFLLITLASIISVWRRRCRDICRRMSDPIDQSSTLTSTVPQEHALENHPDPPLVLESHVATKFQHRDRQNTDEIACAGIVIPSCPSRPSAPASSPVSPFDPASVPDSGTSGTPRLISDENREGTHTMSGGQLVVDLASFPGLLQHLSRVVMAEPPRERVGQDAPPRYEG